MELELNTSCVSGETVVELRRQRDGCIGVWKWSTREIPVDKSLKNKNNSTNNNNNNKYLWINRLHGIYYSSWMYSFMLEIVLKSTHWLSHWSLMSCGGLMPHWLFINSISCISFKDMIDTLNWMNHCLIKTIFLFSLHQIYDFLPSDPGEMTLRTPRRWGPGIHLQLRWSWRVPVRERWHSQIYHWNTYCLPFCPSAWGLFDTRETD